MTAVCHCREDRGAFFEVNGQGRGKVHGLDDGRLCVTPDQAKLMRAYITGEHEARRQVFRRTVAEWIVKHCGHEKQMSNGSVGRSLFRLGYRRRRGRIKTPPLDAKRLARIRRFLVEMMLTDEITFFFAMKSYHQHSTGARSIIPGIKFHLGRLQH